MLLGQWLMPMLFTPVADTAQEAAQPFALGLTLDCPPATACLGPVVGEAQECKASRSFPPFPIRPAELHHPAFLRVDAQPIPLEPLGQDSKHALRVLLHAEPHHKIICVSRQETVPAHPGSDLRREPLVQYDMQKDVRQNGRN